MFWSGNYIVVKEVKFLLRDENVTLSQVLEAEDILQECKADNKALTWYLTQPEILAELVTLITTEPPRDVELAAQYRQANVACEVLTSQLATLSDRLSADAVQMHRLCDFINTEPPLNPLLASYFSKTVEMLLERSPKQDWYLYHIVCLRVLDFFKARRDFLPNLLRHLATSAIADTFKHFIRLDDLFNKVVIEWMDEHQVLEALIQIICGTYEPEPPQPRAAAAAADPPPAAPTDGAADHATDGETAPDAASSAAGAGAAGERLREVAGANAAALLTDIVLGEPGAARSGTAGALVARLRAPGTVRALLAGVFTCPAPRRHAATRHGAALLLALLIDGDAAEGERAAVELALAPHLPLLHQALLLAPPPPPHPLQPSQQPLQPAREESAEGGTGAVEAVGAARVAVAALLARLAASEVREVAATMVTLGTPALMLQLAFRFPHNNFLHAQLAALLRAALGNRPHRGLYLRHLLEECDLLNRLMDAFEENENKRAGAPRRGYMGHVIDMLRDLARHCPPCGGEGEGEGEGEAQGEGERQGSGSGALPAALRARWAAFCSGPLASRAARHDTPLGGYYPSENIYEVENSGDTLADNYDLNVMATGELGEGEAGGEGRGGGPDRAQQHVRYTFDDVNRKVNVDEVIRRQFDHTQNLSWDDGDDDADADADADEEADADADARRCEPLDFASPWESAAASEGEEAGAGDEGWAQFGAQFAPPVDPFAPAPAPADAFWPYSWPAAEEESAAPAGEAGVTGGAEAGAAGAAGAEAAEAARGLAALRLGGAGGGASLACNLLAAMSGMPPHLLADLRALLPPDTDPPAPRAPPAPPAPPLPDAHTDGPTHVDLGPAPPDAPARSTPDTDKPTPLGSEPKLPDDPVHLEIAAEPKIPPLGCESTPTFTDLDTERPVLPVGLETTPIVAPAHIETATEPTLGFRSTPTVRDLKTANGPVDAPSVEAAPATTAGESAPGESAPGESAPGEPAPGEPAEPPPPPATDDAQR